MKSSWFLSAVAGGMLLAATASYTTAAPISPGALAPSLARDASVVERVHFRRHRHRRHHRHHRRFRGYGYGYGIPFIGLSFGRHHGHHDFGHGGFGHGGFGHGGHHGHH